MQDKSKIVAVKRTPGVWAGKVCIKNDFDTLPSGFMDHFE